MATLSVLSHINVCLGQGQYGFLRQFFQTHLCGWNGLIGNALIH